MEQRKLSIKDLIKENVWKNLLVLIVSLISLPLIGSKVSLLDSAGHGNLLSVISILLVTVCFANFSFSYNSTKVGSSGVRLFSHVTTFLFLLLTALLLIMLSELVSVAYPSIGSTVWIFSAILYISVVFYDFWDLMKVAE